MAITTLNNRSINRSDTATSGQVWTATSATAADFQAAGGAWNLIETLTASSSATLSFVNGTDDVVLDSTYDEYVFRFINIHPATDETHLQVNFRDGSTAYDATKTTTTFEARHMEDDSAAALSYDSGGDVAQSTGIQLLMSYNGNDNDQSCSGYMHLFAPSSTTFVKHFMARTSSVQGNDRQRDNYIAGYCNVTAAIDGVQFSMSSGNIDAGKIKLYGIT